MKTETIGTKADFGITELSELAQKLTWKSGCKVIPDGANFCCDVDKQIIYIPSIYIKDQTLRDVLIGAVYHESGHINWTRPLSTIKDITQLKAYAINIFEDIRIEHKIDKYFQGRKKLEVLYGWCLPQVLKQKSSAMNDFHKLGAAIITISRKFLTKNDFPKDFHSTIDDYKSFIKIPANWEEVIELANKFIKKISKDPKFQSLIKVHEEEMAVYEEIEKLKDQIKNIKAQSKEFKKEIQELQNQNRKSKEIIRQLKQQYRTAKKDKSADEKLIQKIAAEENKVQENSIQIVKLREESSTHTKKLKLKELKKLIKIPIVEEFFEELLNAAIKNYITKNETTEDSRIISNSEVRSHIPYTTKYDELNFIETENEEVLEALVNKSESYIRHLSSFLNKFFKINTETVSVRGLRRGKIDRFRLHKTYSIFKQEELREKQETVISIAIDQSGSMQYNGNRMAVAQHLSYVLAMSLQKFKVPCEIISFAATPIQVNTEEPPAEIHNKFARVGYKLVHNVLKEFRRKDCNSLSMLDCNLNTHSGDVQNVDNESVIEIGRRLLNRPEKRKILFVISDGMPSCTGTNTKVMIDNLKLRIKEMEALGVEIVAFGIETNYGKAIYPKYLHINDVKDLLNIGIFEFKKVLIKQRRKER